MNTYNLKRGFLVLILFLAVCGVYSQQPNLSEEENKAKAQELFDAKSYQEAMPLYAQLVSVYSNNSEYNYKFGVCALFGDRTDRRRPIRHLNKALKSMANNADLNYYMGLAYYQNQEFANAMKYLNLYLAKLDPGSAERSVILEKVNACLNGMNLEHKNLISEIISTSEFQLDNYHRAYRADEFDGMLILKPENFVSAKEKNSGENSFVYISEPRGTVYFSGYEKGTESNKDIFKVAMGENGEWGTPEKISGKINSLFDENYPVLTNGGTTLYFCSKGHNSLGGYDIFKSDYNASNKTFSEPENLGIGINSPFDDILFIPDKTGEFAYFSTNRDNLNNSINVYKVRLNESSIGEEIMLAQNSASSKESNNGQESHVKPGTNQETKTQPVIAQSQPKVTPTVKAASLKRDRTNLNLMADTAYLLVSNTKSLIRSLTNKRDRANAIRSKKKEEAKVMELQLDQDLAKIHEYSNQEEFEMALQKTIDLKKQIVQKKKSAEHANLIAWKIGKYIKIKNAELQATKVEAGNVQSLSVSGNVEETQIVYTDLMSRYNYADTLKDFSTDILQIAQGNTTYDVPEKALAYAEDLRQGFLNNTLIADVTSVKPKVDSSVPIKVIDNRTNNTVAKVLPKVIALKQIEEVEFNLADNTAFITEDESLEIDFTIDAIEAEKIVEQVLFANADAEIEIDDPSLELNFEIDMIEASPIVEMVAYNETGKLTIDEQLEIRFEIDMIEASPIVEMIAFNHSEELIINEQLEINIEKEIQADPLVQPIMYSDASTDIDLDESSLELKFDIDIIEASPVVEMIALNETEELLIDEELEINVEKEIYTDPLVKQVIFAETLAEIEIEDPALELKFEVDIFEASSVVEMIAFNESENDINIDDELEVSLEEEVPTVQLVEPIFLASNATEIEIDDPSLELSFVVDAIIATPVVQTIAYAYNDEVVLEDENLDLSFSIDRNRIPAYSIIQPIRKERYADMIEVENGKLDINIENDLNDIKVAKIVNSIPLTLNDDVFVDENIEIDFSVDYIISEENIEPVYANFTDESFETADEELEINIENAPMETAYFFKLVQPVYNEKLTSSDTWPEDTELEITNDLETIEPFDLIQPVEFVEFATTFDTENEIEINYVVDELDNAESLASAISSLNKRLASESINSMPAIGVELFYLRESLEIANDIETSRTDFEMLTLALTNPVDLSYEELLFAASLAQNPKDKLSIFNQAFIHIDRDWRAFNNAAISAINISDLETAECFLYQASLISDKNGKIVNNMGILACYKNEFENAKNYFATASDYGVNADYNLKVVQNIYGSNSDSPSNFRQELGDHNYYEVLGDASEIQKN